MWNRSAKLDFECFRIYFKMFSSLHWTILVFFYALFVQWSIIWPTIQPLPTPTPISLISSAQTIIFFIYLFDASKVENGLQMIIFECIDQRVCYKNISFTLYVTKHKQKVNILPNLDLSSFPSCSGLPPCWGVQPDTFFICWSRRWWCSL